MWLAGVAIAAALLGGWYGVNRYEHAKLQDLVNSIKPEVVEIAPVEPPDTWSNPVPTPDQVPTEPAPCPPWYCGPDPDNTTPVPVPHHGHRWHRHHWHGHHHHHNGGTDDLPFMPPFPR